MVNYLRTQGFAVVVVQKETTDLQGIIDRTGIEDLTGVLPEIAHCDFFMGVSSGLSWVAWALERPVIMISGWGDAVIIIYTYD